jgi:2-hydroxy-3-keto-5-methylthiopentenyl-1-phosphate phosphatase
MKANSQPGTRSSARLSPIVFCDFDGTITQLDVTDQILTQLAHPSWREIEQEWVRGLIGSRECLERQMALVETSTKELDALIDAIPIDPDFPAFYRFIQMRGLPFYMVSDGFDYFIRRILKRSGFDEQLRNGAYLFSSCLRVRGRRLIASFPRSAVPCEHGCATCKAAIIRRLGAGRRPIIFIGDGLSDRFAVEESHVVFAKRQLLAYCREKGIACRPFETFAEIQRALAKLLGSGTSNRPQGKSQKLKVEGLGLKVESRKSNAARPKSKVLAVSA